MFILGGMKENEILNFIRTFRGNEFYLSMDENTSGGFFDRFFYELDKNLWKNPWRKGLLSELILSRNFNRPFSVQYDRGTLHVYFSEDETDNDSLEIDMSGKGEFVRIPLELDSAQLDSDSEELGKIYGFEPVHDIYLYYVGN